MIYMILFKLIKTKKVCTVGAMVSMAPSIKHCLEVYHYNYRAYRQWHDGGDHHIVLWLAHAGVSPAYLKITL